jgi:hypothetical protein
MTCVSPSEFIFEVKARDAKLTEGKEEESEEGRRKESRFHRAQPKKKEISNEFQRRSDLPSKI